VAEVTQQLDRPNPATGLGKGKVDELRLRIEEHRASLVVFDDELFVHDVVFEGDVPETLRVRAR
jgi:50S ribosomal subunit-associated GTPase HflX